MLLESQLLVASQSVIVGLKNVRVLRRYLRDSEPRNENPSAVSRGFPAGPSSTRVISNAGLIAKTRAARYYVAACLLMLIFKARRTRKVSFTFRLGLLKASPHRHHISLWA